MGSGLGAGGTKNRKGGKQKSRSRAEPLGGAGSGLFVWLRDLRDARRDLGTACRIRFRRARIGRLRHQLAIGLACSSATGPGRGAVLGLGPLGGCGGCTVAGTVWFFGAAAVVVVVVLCVIQYQVRTEGHL